MKIALLGYGLQGRAAYDYWSGENEITVCDGDASLVLPADVQKQLGPNHLSGLDRFDLIVRSPIIHPTDIELANGPEVMSKVTTVTNEFMRVCPTSNVICVTGTKGKGTTSTLTAEMLKAAGKRVHLGGNIGIPPLDMLKGDIQPEDWVVLELANFQLIDLQYSPHIATCLMVTPEHLNWHKDMSEYVNAKSQLFAHQASNDIAIYYAPSQYSKQIAASSSGHKIPYFALPGAVVTDGVITIDRQEICRADELKLLGEHNWQNACAAVTTAWQVTHDVAALRTALTSFAGLEHRLELVRELGDVRYYDDSFGTTPETAIVAMQAFKQPKVVILGGSDKGASYDELALAVKQSNVHTAVLIGDEADKIQAALDRAGFTDYVAGSTSMQEIVTTCKEKALPGDVVLLSTGCASFGLFHDYKDRGNQFKQVVQALAPTAE